MNPYAEIAKLVVLAWTLHLTIMFFRLYSKGGNGVFSKAHCMSYGCVCGVIFVFSMIDLLLGHSSEHKKWVKTIHWINQVLLLVISVVLFVTVVKHLRKGADGMSRLHIIIFIVLDIMAVAASLYASRMSMSE